MQWLRNLWRGKLSADTKNDGDDDGDAAVVQNDDKGMDNLAASPPDQKSAQTSAEPSPLATSAAEPGPSSVRRGGFVPWPRLAWQGFRQAATESSFSFALLAGGGQHPSWHMSPFQDGKAAAAIVMGGCDAVEIGKLTKCLGSILHRQVVGQRNSQHATIWAHTLPGAGRESVVNVHFCTWLHDWLVVQITLEPRAASATHPVRCPVRIDRRLSPGAPLSACRPFGLPSELMLFGSSTVLSPQVLSSSPSHGGVALGGSKIRQLNVTLGIDPVEQVRIINWLHALATLWKHQCLSKTAMPASAAEALRGAVHYRAHYVLCHDAAAAAAAPLPPGSGHAWPQVQRAIQQHGRRLWMCVRARIPVALDHAAAMACLSHTLGRQTSATVDFTTQEICVRWPVAPERPGGNVTHWFVEAPAIPNWQHHVVEAQAGARVHAEPQYPMPIRARTFWWTPTPPTLHQLTNGAAAAVAARPKVTVIHHHKVRLAPPATALPPSKRRRLAEPPARATAPLHPVPPAYRQQPSDYPPKPHLSEATAMAGLFGDPVNWNSLAY